VLEVEMKFPAPEFGRLEERLRQWGARAEPPRQDADQYFNAPDRDFARTDEAFRLRRIGDANFITYKGPKLDAQTKTRTEIEVPLEAGAAAAEAFARLVVCLGYRPTALVRKQRRVFHVERSGFALEVCLDDVDEVGRYAELEILAPEQQLDEARAVLMKTAEELGLSGSERRSYLQLLLTARGSERP
jgi:adenylate cyclase, class 2